jgi:hypothetical protein
MLNTARSSVLVDPQFGALLRLHLAGLLGRHSKTGRLVLREENFTRAGEDMAAIPPLPLLTQVKTSCHHQDRLARWVTEGQTVPEMAEKIVVERWIALPPLRQARGRTGQGL